MLLHVSLSKSIIMCTCVCFFCPLHITGMGNQWVQWLSLWGGKKRMNAACDFLLKECGYDVVHLLASGFFSPLAPWGLSTLFSPTGQKHIISGTRGASFGPPTCSYNTCMCFSATIPQCLSFAPFFAPINVKLQPYSAVYSICLFDKQTHLLISDYVLKTPVAWNCLECFAKVFIPLELFHKSHLKHTKRSNKKW